MAARKKSKTFLYLGIAAAAYFLFMRNRGNSNTPPTPPGGQTQDPRPASDVIAQGGHGGAHGGAHGGGGGAQTGTGGRGGQQIHREQANNARMNGFLPTWNKIYFGSQN